MVWILRPECVFCSNLRPRTVIYVHGFYPNFEAKQLLYFMVFLTYIQTESFDFLRNFHVNFAQLERNRTQFERNLNVIERNRTQLGFVYVQLRFFTSKYGLLRCFMDQNSAP